jgi:hypothetical protein
MAGRPEMYTEELGKTICGRIATGESVRSICADEKMPAASSIFRWLLDEDKKPFWEQYARARAIQAELMFEELLDIADDSSEDLLITKQGPMENKEFVNRSKLRVDTRKWYLSKVLPKKFGDKLDVTSDGKALPTPIYGGKSDPEKV